VAEGAEGVLMRLNKSEEKLEDLAESSDDEDEEKAEEGASRAYIKDVQQRLKVLEDNVFDEEESGEEGVLTRLEEAEEKLDILEERLDNLAGSETDEDEDEEDRIIRLKDLEGRIKFLLEVVAESKDGTDSSVIARLEEAEGKLSALEEQLDNLGASDEDEEIGKVSLKELAERVEELELVVNDANAGSADGILDRLGETEGRLREVRVRLSDLEEQVEDLEASDVDEDDDNDDVSADVINELSEKVKLEFKESEVGQQAQEPISAEQPILKAAQKSEAAVRKPEARLIKPKAVLCYREDPDGIAAAADGLYLEGEHGIRARLDAVDGIFDAFEDYMVWADGRSEEGPTSTDTLLPVKAELKLLRKKLDATPNAELEARLRKMFSRSLFFMPVEDGDGWIGNVIWETHRQPCNCRLCKHIVNTTGRPIEGKVLEIMRRPGPSLWGTAFDPCSCPRCQELAEVGLYQGGEKVGALEARPKSGDDEDEDAGAAEEDPEPQPQDVTGQAMMAEDARASPMDAFSAASERATAAGSPATQHPQVAMQRSAATTLSPAAAEELLSEAEMRCGPNKELVTFSDGISDEPEQQLDWSGTAADGGDSFGVEVESIPKPLRAPTAGTDKAAVDAAAAARSAAADAAADAMNTAVDATAAAMNAAADTAAVAANAAADAAAAAVIAAADAAAVADMAGESADSSVEGTAGQQKIDDYVLHWGDGDEWNEEIEADARVAAGVPEETPDLEADLEADNGETEHRIIASRPCAPAMMSCNPFSSLKQITCYHFSNLRLPSM
jgi:hypothetical protein